MALRRKQDPNPHARNRTTKELPANEPVEGVEVQVKADLSLHGLSSEIQLSMYGIFLGSRI